MSAIDVYRALNKVARSQARPFGEILSLYALERVLGRLVETPFATHFVLKGGMLLAAYDMRRPTRDIDAEALEFTSRRGPPAHRDRSCRCRARRRWPRTRCPLDLLHDHP